MKAVALPEVLNLYCSIEFHFLEEKVFKRITEHSPEKLRTGFFSRSFEKETLLLE